MTKKPLFYAKEALIGALARSFFYTTLTFQCIVIYYLSHFKMYMGMITVFCIFLSQWMALSILERRR